MTSYTQYMLVYWYFDYSYCGPQETSHLYHSGMDMLKDARVQTGIYASMYRLVVQGFVIGAAEVGKRYGLLF